MASACRIGALVAAALALGVPFPAQAQITTLDGDSETRLLVFSGRDLWRNGLFGHGGLLFAPGGIDQDGFNLKLVMSGGVYRYTGGPNSGDPPGSLAGWTILGVENAFQVMPGFRVKRGALEAKVFFGLDLEYHWLWPDDVTNHLRGRSLGLRFAGEIWYEPTPLSMVAADASLSSVGNQSARLAVGWRVFDCFYFGPETQVYGADGYRQWRLGAHFTALKTGETTEWVAAVGWGRESSGQSTPYARFGIVTRH